MNQKRTFFIQIGKHLKKLLKRHQNILRLSIKVFALISFAFIIYNAFSTTKYKKTDIKIAPIDSKTTQTSMPTLQPSPKGVLLPSQVLDLTNWKITLPIGSSRNAMEIKQPELANYTINPWFAVSQKSDAVIFRAPVNGLTTSGSDYPRSELREMSDNGKVNANWSSEKGEHTMFLDQTITAVPKVKQQIVAGQIHDDDKDIIVIRLDLPNLHIRVDGENVHTLDDNYTLGKRFTIKFVVENNQTKVYYNNSTDSVYTLNKSYSDAYFKAGAYAQSNCDKEGTSLLCNENNYGEVVLYQLGVTHQ